MKRALDNVVPPIGRKHAPKLRGADVVPVKRSGRVPSRRVTGGARNFRGWVGVDAGLEGSAKRRARKAWCGMLHWSASFLHSPIVPSMVAGTSIRPAISCPDAMTTRGFSAACRGRHKVEVLVGSRANDLHPDSIRAGLLCRRAPSCGPSLGHCRADDFVLSWASVWPRLRHADAFGVHRAHRTGPDCPDRAAKPWLQLNDPALFPVLAGGGGPGRESLLPEQGLAMTAFPPEPVRHVSRIFWRASADTSILISRTNPLRSHTS